MPFAPQYLEAGEIEILESILAVVHRDMKTYLDGFYLADNLPAFVVMTDGDIDTFDYPLLVVGVERMSSKMTVSGEWLDQVLTVGAGIVVNDVSVKAVKAKARKYVRAFKAVLRAATAADLLPPTAQFLEYVVDIDHQYLRHGTKGTEFTQPVTFDIQITFGEK